MLVQVGRYHCYFNVSTNMQSIFWFVMAFAIVWSTVLLAFLTWQSVHYSTGHGVVRDKLFSHQERDFYQHYHDALDELLVTAAGSDDKKSKNNNQNNNIDNWRVPWKPVRDDFDIFQLPLPQTTTSTTKPNYSYVNTTNLCQVANAFATYQANAAAQPHPHVVWWRATPHDQVNKQTANQDKDPEVEWQDQGCNVATMQHYFQHEDTLAVMVSDAMTYQKLQYFYRHNQRRQKASTSTKQQDSEDVDEHQKGYFPPIQFMPSLDFLANDQDAQQFFQIITQSTKATSKKFKANSNTTQHDHAKNQILILQDEWEALKPTPAWISALKTVGPVKIKTIHPHERTTNGNGYNLPSFYRDLQQSKFVVALSEDGTIEWDDWVWPALLLECIPIVQMPSSRVANADDDPENSRRARKLKLLRQKKGTKTTTNHHQQEKKIIMEQQLTASIIVQEGDNYNSEENEIIGLDSITRHLPILWVSDYAADLTPPDVFQQDYRQLVIDANQRWQQPHQSHYLPRNTKWRKGYPFHQLQQTYWIDQAIAKNEQLKKNNKRTSSQTTKQKGKHNHS